MKLNKPDNFDGIVFIAALKDAGFNIDEVVDDGEGSLIIAADDKDLAKISAILNEG